MAERAVNELLEQADKVVRAKFGAALQETISFEDWWDNVEDALMAQESIFESTDEAEPFQWLITLAEHLGFNEAILQGLKKLEESKWG